MNIEKHQEAIRLLNRFETPKGVRIMLTEDKNDKEKLYFYSNSKVKFFPNHNKEFILKSVIEQRLHQIDNLIFLDSLSFIEKGESIFNLSLITLLDNNNATKNIITHAIREMFKQDDKAFEKLLYYTINNKSSVIFDTFTKVIHELGMSLNDRIQNVWYGILNGGVNIITIHKNLGDTFDYQSLVSEIVEHPNYITKSVSDQIPIIFENYNIDISKLPKIKGNKKKKELFQFYFRSNNIDKILNEA